MTDLALSFAREILDWPDAIPKVILGTEIIGRDSNPLAEFFHRDLNDVMARVREWIESRRKYYLQIHGGYGPWDVMIIGKDDISHASGFDLCHALLSVCIEASRKLKARAA